MEEKIVGYALIATGVITMAFCGLSVYNIFTNKSQPVTLFSFPSIKMDMSQIMSASLPEEVRNLGIKIPEAKQEILSADMVNRPMNLIFHTVLMGFISSLGLKIGQLGTMLVRTINVTVKERATQTQK